MIVCTNCIHLQSLILLHLAIGSTQNSQALKNNAALKAWVKKSCEIKGGGQEMAAKMQINFFNNACVVNAHSIISINIIAPISIEKGPTL